MLALMLPWKHLRDTHLHLNLQAEAVHPLKVSLPLSTSSRC